MRFGKLSQMRGLDDLKPEVQKRVLRELGLKSAKDGNYDVFPLFTLVSAQTGHDE